MLDLTRELYNIITRSLLRWKTIQLIGAHEESNPFITYESDDLLEIGLSKQTYLGVFKECHTYWHSIVGRLEEMVANSSQHQLWDLYIMTLGYLITTNENHSIITLHEAVTFEIYRKYDQGILHQDFEIFTVYLSSRLKRINKSSSLWFWMQKLSILVIYDPWSQGVNTNEYYEKLLDRLFKSCLHHFANYYANNFMKWVGNVNYILHKDDMGLVERLVESCRQHLTDVSLWTSLASLLQRGSSKSIMYALQDYNAIVGKLNHNNVRELKSTGKIVPSFNYTFIMAQIQWLVGVECTVFTPYNTMVSTILIMAQDSDIKECREYLSTNQTETEKGLFNFASNSSIYPQKEKFNALLKRLVKVINDNQTI